MNKFFSLPFYRDAMKRLRLSGIIFLFVCVLIGLLPILLHVGGDGYLFAVQETTVVLCFYMYTGPVVLTFTAFSFLFKRSASDVYHALPLTRRGLYLSIASSVLTYVAGTVIVTVGSAYLLMALRGWPMDWSNFFPAVLSYLFGSMLVTACALVGVSATGTRFSAFVVGGVLLFLPRCIMLLSVLIIGQTAPMLVPGGMGLLFDISYNFPVSVFFNGGFGSFFGIGGYGGGLEQVFLSISTKVYTLLLALVYIALGGYLFHRRASETAGMSAPGRRTQHLYRSLLTMPLFMLIGVMAVMGYYNSYVPDSMLTVLIVIALLVYFVYELITTRKWKNLLSALYVLPIPIAAALGFCLCVALYGNIEQQRLPAKEEIQSIQFYSDGRYEMSYQELVLHEQRFENPDILALVADGLSFSAKLESGRSSYVNTTTRTLRVNLKNGQTLYRNIRIPYQEDERFSALVNRDPQFIMAVSSLPADEEILSHSHYGSKYFDGFDEGFARVVWSSYQKEAFRLDPMERSAMIGSNNLALIPAAEPATKNYYPRFTQEPAALDHYFSISGLHNGRRFRNYIHITTATPETANLVMHKVNAGADAALMDTTAASLAADTPYEWGSVSLRLYNVDNGGVRMHSDEISLSLEGVSMDKEYPRATQSEPASADMDVDKRALMQTLLRLDRTQVDAAKPFVKFSIDISYMGEDDTYEGVYIPTVYAALDDAALARVLECFPENWFEELR